MIRGSSTIEHDVDAFGREVKTFNSQFLQVDYNRDACGRVVFTSDPYTSQNGSQGTAVVYDALGRVTQVTDQAGKTDHLYLRRRADPAHRRQQPHDDLRSLAYGESAGGPISSVTDSLGNTTNYRYDVTGALTQVTGP